MLDGLVLDLRHAVRSYAKRPGFTAAAVGMLALGIGANTAIFSVAYALVFKPLSYPEPERLVSLWPETAVDKMMAAATAERARSFEATSAYGAKDFTLAGDGDPVVVAGAQVGPRHFDVLGARALLGRTFRPGEDAPGQSHVVVLGYPLWRERFAADPGIVGRRIGIEGEQYTVVGVMPQGFQPLQPGWKMWTPLPVNRGDTNDYLNSFYLQMVGRLRPGVSPARAQAELAGLARELRKEYPNLITPEKSDGVLAAPLHEQLVGRARPTLVVLLAAVGVVLLIACGNVANLLLARASERRREVAVRTALGAAPGRLVRQILTESLLLGAAGGALGLALAFLAVRAIPSLLPEDTQRASEIAVNGPVLAFSFLVSLVSAVLFGMVPARRAATADPQTALSEETQRGSLGRGGRRSGQVLVVTQVAAATVLLIAAGLLLKSLARLQSVPPGFDVDGVLTMRLDLVDARYPTPAAKVDYYRRVLERMAALPGVTGAGAIQLLPLTSQNWHFPYVAQDHPIAPGSPEGTVLPDADFRIVTPGYFRAMRIRLLQGRPLAATDAAESAPVGLVGRTMARQLWPRGDAVGKTIQLFGQGGPEFTVVGVVDDVHSDRLDASPRPTIYRPLSQWPNGSMFVMLRTALPPASVAASARAAVRSIDPGVPLSQVRPMREVVRTSVADERFTSMLITGFALLAALLAVSGVYSVISYALARRAREIGIRLALGAQPGDVFRSAIGEGALLAGAGVAVGLLGAVAVTRVLASRLFAVSTLDAAVFLLSAFLVAAAAIASCWLPAWRATRVSPAGALQHE
ncbi:MAG TPA: ABC transporter permease [Longimicrobiaceae bacterium]|nr:ABC transporter permease [Longimicrobiaceae bacterium]